MKKVFLAIVLFLSIGAIGVNAQIISLGIKAEANGSNFLLSDMSGAKSMMGTGGTFGGFIKLDLLDNLALQPEILFNYQTSKIKVSDVKNDFEYMGLEIPVYVMGQWTVSSGHRFFAGVGPYVGFGLSAKYKDPDINLYDSDEFQRLDFGAKAMIGFEFANGIQINAGYKLGLLNLKKEGDGKMLTEVMSLGVGYRF